MFGVTEPTRAHTSRRPPKIIKRACIERCPGAETTPYLQTCSSEKRTKYLPEPLQEGRTAAPPAGAYTHILQLNLRAFCVTGGAVRGCRGGVLGVVGDIRRVQGELLFQKRLKLS